MADYKKTTDNGNGDGYDIWKLLSRRHFDEYPNACNNIQIICDIDKTYLETQFDSLIDIAKIAIEQAEDKKTAPGAMETLMSLRWGSSEQDVGEKNAYPRRLHFVSSSPPQLRKVLSKKLRQDGLDWTSDTLKDQAYNIKRGQFKLLRKQIAYKTAALLTLMNSREGKNYVLIGDSAESDAYIYLGINLLLSGKLSQTSFEKYLQIAEVPEAETQAITRALSDHLREKRAPWIFIRNIEGVRLQKCPPLTDPILDFEDYFEMALHSLVVGILDPQSVPTIAVAMHNQYGRSLAWLKSELLAVSRHLDQPTRELLDPLHQRLSHIAPPQQPHDRYRPPDLSDFSTLGEKDILELADIWFETLSKIDKDNHRSKNI